MTVEGRVHAETFVAAAGAIAGYAAQRALFDRLERAPEASQMALATTASGDQFFFGEPLNQSLLSQSEFGRSRKAVAFDGGGGNRGRTKA